MDATDRAVDTITSFLRLVEERRLEEAASYLAPDVIFTFPGGRTFSNLQELVASSGTRFRTVRKVFERFDVVEADDSVIVYSSGTLEGESLRGGEFSGIRYIDRFIVREGLIVDQAVWNDLAEAEVIPTPD